MRGSFIVFIFAYVSSSLLSSCSCRSKVLILGALSLSHQCCNVACMLSPVWQANCQWYMFSFLDGPVAVNHLVIFSKVVFFWDNVLPSFGN